MCIDFKQLKCTRWFLLIVMMITMVGLQHAVAQSPEAAATSAGAAPAKELPGLLDPDLGTAFFTVVTFVVLLIILRFAAWKPILTGLKSRENAIRESIEAAAKARVDADRATREMQAQMDAMRQQAQKQLEQAKADATKLADGIKAQAEKDSAALKDRTLREIDAAKQQALTDINSHAAELGTSIARKILQRNVTVDDQNRLVTESLAQMREPSKN